MKYFHYQQPFTLESGQVLPEITIAYSTHGKRNEAQDNVVWVCHALTANAAVQDWWPGFVGPDCLINPDQHFIVCANILGSCYGSTGPLSIHPKKGQPYYHTFPLITIRDMVRAHQLLCEHLNIKKIHLLIGGSMGGYQALEWCALQPSLIDRLFLIATSARESAWGIAIHTTQRLAIEADSTWHEATDKAGQQGLKAARAIGMLTYRSYATYAATQMDGDLNKLDHFKASSYIHYQGTKLVNRFNAYSYWFLTKAMDSHNLARGRCESVETTLQSIHQKTLVMGIKSDLLCPVIEQETMAQYMPNAELEIIDSLYGHDGFLLETEQISKAVSKWLSA